jgi:Alkylmercury lyase
MTQPFPVKSAAALMDASFEARWLDRSRIGPAARSTLRAILDAFVAHGGPVEIASLGNDAAVAELDERDLIYVSEGRVHLAYPFAGTPTDFVTVLPGGRERWACCAIDALDMPAFLKQPVTVRSRCHHCGEDFVLEVTPEGPVGDEDLMAWVGERTDLRGKACTSL